MSKDKLDCYILPSSPVPLLLPAQCVAEVVADPQLESMEKSPTNWIKGHVNWQNQRLPVMSYAALHFPNLNESKKRKARLVVLNPIPDVARKAYSGLLCYGDVKQVSVDESMTYAELPEGMDRRYVEAVVKIGNNEFIIPRLTALGVAFTYV